MTLDEIIRNFEDQAIDREDSVDEDDPDCIFRKDARALREAIGLLSELAEYRKAGLEAADIQEAVNLLNDTIHPGDLPTELKSWVERCAWHVKKCEELREAEAKLIDRNVVLLNRIAAAELDIAALIWLDKRCEYCTHGLKICYSGASRWACRLGGATGCRPEWRGEQPE